VWLRVPMPAIATARPEEYRSDEQNGAEDDGCANRGTGRNSVSNGAEGLTRRRRVDHPLGCEAAAPSLPSLRCAARLQSWRWCAPMVGNYWKPIDTPVDQGATTRPFYPKKRAFARLVRYGNLCRERNYVSLSTSGGNMANETLGLLGD
jgi:hypothetical protein